MIGAVLVFFLARWAGQPADDGLGGRTIQGMYGLLVAGALALLILAYAWAHRLVNSVACPPPRASIILERVLRPLGQVFTRIDFFLVFNIADYSGAGSFSPSLRAFHFGAYFSIALGAALLLPPPWGLTGVAMALLSILALNRKWSWVEEDRRNYVLSGFYDVSSNANLGIGFEQDYRDVALTALALMIVTMPLAMMQMAAFGIFETKDGSPIGELGTLEWFIFFGGEMAKSVPFVDWSEVYGAETVTPIQPRHGGGQHAVFFVRALVDLVLLAGFIQAFELSNRLARQQANFRDPQNPERILDPFLERDAFRDIANFVTPERAHRLETDIIERLPERLGSFAKYSNQQIGRVLMKGEAPEFWRPDHETAMALIVPHRNGGAPAPRFFVRLYDPGVISETLGQSAQERDVHERTQIGAIIAALGTNTAGYADARNTAYANLPKFLESEDERVWSSAACAIAEVAIEPEFPAHAMDAFAEALAEGTAERMLSRSQMLHQALVHVSNAQRPTEADQKGRPHLSWTVELLANQLQEHSDFQIRRSAIEALGDIEFVPGAALNRAQGALANVANELRPHMLSWKRLFPWLKGQRIRRLALKCNAKISVFENAVL